MLKAGDRAPGFSNPDADMELVELSRFRGKPLVLFFYVRDDTPGCTAEAIEFSELENDFAKLGATVLGVSRDDCLTHATFRDQHGLTISLLSDPEGDVCRMYGVLQEQENEGVRRECLVRSTFVIDKKGVIRHAAYGVTPRGHAAEVYDVVKRLRA